MDNDSSKNPKGSLSEETKEEIYQVSSNLVDELISEAVEGIRSEIDEYLRLIFHPDADISKLDDFTKSQINSLKEVFNLFKTNFKEEILSEIKKELPKIIKKVKLAKPKKSVKKKRKYKKKKK
ncbi:MAG: hypothetical protein HWN67_19115 [Candidatus Helarchaeota archaeon]|nr:hypothetical protein [Candidatus Helarchaeota archaeon]